MAQHPKEKRWTIYVCECGQDWMGYNSKYCPAGHAYRFTKVEVVPALVAERLAAAARAYLAAQTPRPRQAGTYTSEEMQADVEWQASQWLTPVHRELLAALEAYSGDST